MRQGSTHCLGQLPARVKTTAQRQAGISGASGLMALGSEQKNSSAQSTLYLNATVQRHSGTAGSSTARSSTALAEHCSCSTESYLNATVQRHSRPSRGLSSGGK